ncbi:MAG TPA: hypothetical protein PKA41_19915 [Verrucomicrobiota bacterium]|nr:hypothetical protein [Verrucomicrobiota bacterium]
MKTRALILTAMTAISCCIAQNYSLDWSTIDSGGGDSVGGTYSLSGTIGQPDAGAMSGGNFSLQGGFWTIAAVQIPGAPLLTIRATSTNTVIISWPSPSTGFSLHQNSDLATTNWIPSAIPDDDGFTKTVIINAPVGNQFFRLSSQ